MARRALRAEFTIPSEGPIPPNVVDRLLEEIATLRDILQRCRDLLGLAPATAADGVVRGIVDLQLAVSGRRLPDGIFNVRAED